MFAAKLKTACALSIIALFALIASVGGLLLDGLYRDNWSGWGCGE
jgi:hypothetical protein